MLEVNLLLTEIIYGYFDGLETLMILVSDVDGIQILFEGGVQRDHPHLQIVHFRYAGHLLHVPHRMPPINALQLGFVGVRQLVHTVQGHLVNVSVFVPVSRLKQSDHS